MKDFDKPIPQTEEIEIVSQKEVEAKVVIGNISMHKGHTMFEVNFTTGSIVPAKYEEVTVSFETGAAKRKILCNDNCIYVPCLNIKSAKKKVAKYIIENIKRNEEEIHLAHNIAKT